MNIEHLCRSVLENFHRIKDLKKALLYVRYQFELLAWKRQKLKLGAIVFEIKKIIIANITLHEDIEIRYIRQDTTKDDDLKIENRLKALGWQWDFKNIGAFIVVFTLAMIFLYASVYVWYCENLPTLAYRDPDADKMIHFAFETSFNSPSLQIFRSLLFTNFLLIETLTNFCTNFDMLF
jgi:hypothetical protein